MSIFASQRQDQEKDEYAKERKVMDDIDENGWAQIHHSAFHGYTRSVQRYVAASEDQLEFPTNDHRHMTPLLIAVENGRFDTIQCLVELGADLRYENSDSFGVIELACLRGDEHVIKYFLDLNHKDLPVWQKLFKFICSDQDENGECAGKIINNLSKPIPDKDNPDGKLINPEWKVLVEIGAVKTLFKVIQSLASEKTKYLAFRIILNIIEEDKVKERIVQAGGVPVILSMFETKDKDTLLASTCMLCHLLSIGKTVDQVVQTGGITKLIHLTETNHDIDVLTEVVNSISYIALANDDNRKTIGTTSGCFSALVGLFDNSTSNRLLMALTQAVSSIVKHDKNNQNGFVEQGGASALIALAGKDNRNLQLNSIKAIHDIAHDNSHTQKIILEEGGVIPLMQLLKRSGAPEVLVCCASALWALAGDDIEECRVMAGMIGVNLLIDFLNAQSEHDILHSIGAEGLSVLAQGPLNKQDLIAKANGVEPLVGLLRSPKENIVLSAIRALRNLCVGIGYIPHQRNQKTILSSRGIRYLVALMVHSKNDLVRVESALTLGCCTVGNSEVMGDISENIDFSYIHILRLLYSKDKLVRLLAGAALAAFAYNNIAQQREIDESGGVRYHCFSQFLESDDEFFRCCAAFQVVVLARIIPDEDQATSSAIGLKLLVDLLEQSKNNLILSLTADCLARLSHTRAGIPAAVVSINAVDMLCKLMMAENEQVRGSAAIALGYLTFNHTAERQLLNRCRIDPYLYKVLRYYTTNYKIAASFLEEWKHYRHIGLPPIDTSQRPSIVGQKAMPYLKSFRNSNQRRLTMLTFGESGQIPHQSSPTNMLSSSFHEEGTVTDKGNEAASPQVSQRKSNYASSARSHFSRKSIQINLMEA